MSERYYAIIDRRSPRTEHWERVMGTDCLEIESTRPERRRNDDGSTGMYYRIKVDALNEYQLGRVVRVFVMHWRMTEVEVLAELRGDHGLMIEANEVVVCTDPVEGRIELAWRGVVS